MGQTLKEYHLQLSISDGIKEPVKEFSLSILADTMENGLGGLRDKLEGIRTAIKLANERVEP